MIHGRDALSLSLFTDRSESPILQYRRWYYIKPPNCFDKSNIPKIALWPLRNQSSLITLCSRSDNVRVCFHGNLSGSSEEINVNKIVSWRFNPLSDDNVFRLVQIETNCRQQFKVYLK